MHLARLAAEQLLEPDPQCARRLVCRLFRIFTRRVPRISATSRRGAAAHGDDNTFLFWSKSHERARWRVSPLVVETFIVQNFEYVTMAHLYWCVLVVNHP